LFRFHNFYSLSMYKVIKNWHKDYSFKFINLLSSTFAKKHSQQWGWWQIWISVRIQRICANTISKIMYSPINDESEYQKFEQNCRTCSRNFSQKFVIRYERSKINILFSIFHVTLNRISMSLNSFLKSHDRFDFLQHSYHFDNHVLQLSRHLWLRIYNSITSQSLRLYILNKLVFILLNIQLCYL